MNELAAFAEAVSTCTRCRLAEGRTQVVFGVGNPHADLVFVGEAPGFHEDKNGVPFVGRAGKLLSKLLEEVGLSREDVYIANVLKCRPPGNRDPQPDEIESCEPHLFRQIELIRPKVIATLGNFATKLMTGSPLGITRVHGQEQQTTVGGLSVLLYPLYHPAAALYTPRMLEVLRTDFAHPGADGAKTIATGAAEPAAVRGAGGGVRGGSARPAGRATRPLLTAAPHTSILICATQRTGSWLLAHLLRGTGVAGKAAEHFNQADLVKHREAWGVSTDREYLAAALAAGTTPNGVFALKIMWNTLEGTLFRLRRLSGDHTSRDDEVLGGAFAGPRYVWLTRRDVVAQAVSWAKAAQTEQWAAHLPAVRVPEYDFEQIDGLAHLVRFHTGQWRRWFAGHDVEPLEVEYEDLAADADGVTRRVLAWVGLEPPEDPVIAPPPESDPAGRPRERRLDREVPRGGAGVSEAAGRARRAFTLQAVTVESASPEETERIAAELAARLEPGDVVTVSGELGAGKTTFVRGACRALGVAGRVTSPTFTIGHRYRGRVDVSHLDLYRFQGVSAAEWADLEPYFEDAITFVEWPEAAGGGLPRVRARVRLSHVDSARRLVEIETDADPGF